MNISLRCRHHIGTARSWSRGAYTWSMASRSYSVVFGTATRSVSGGHYSCGCGSTSAGRNTGRCLSWSDVSRRGRETY
jgi:hypothetical protein